jgi:hypothetical protein
MDRLLGRDALEDLAPAIDGVDRAARDGGG